jgi:hypothetical protein
MTVFKGEPPLNNAKLTAIRNEFKSMTGWAKIKRSVEELVRLCDSSYKQQLNGKPALPVVLNRLFLGNPGTGKSTCGEMYGRLLKELNFLSIGEVVRATASDLVGQFIGESQQKTNTMLEKAKGKVLIIDEAYNLDDKMYGKQVSYTSSLINQRSSAVRRPRLWAFLLLRGHSNNT